MPRYAIFLTNFAYNFSFNCFSDKSHQSKIWSRKIITKLNFIAGETSLHKEKKKQENHKIICFKTQLIGAKYYPIAWGAIQLKLSQATWFLLPLVKPMPYAPAAMDVVQKAVPEKNSGPSVLAVLFIKCPPNYRPSSGNLTSRHSPKEDLEIITHWHFLFH